MELYEKLIHLRKQKGLSQLKLAEELGVCLLYTSDAADER